MKRSTFIRNALVVGGGSLIWAPSGKAQGAGQPDRWIFPLSRRIERTGPVEVRAIEAAVQIDGQMARTALTLELHNPAGRQQEGEVLLPVPQGAALKEFAMEGSGQECTAELLPHDEARRIYDGIVRRLQDPAILEFAGLAAVRSSVFPVPAGGGVRLRLVYEELLPAEGDRIDYVLPRSEALDSGVRWSIKLTWKVKGGIATLYSPSHEIASRSERGQARVALDGAVNPGPFRLSALRRRQREAVASFLTHPDPGGDGGHFLLLIATSERDENAPQLKREVTLVIDRSGSMAGEKLDQVRAAALQVVEGLEEGETFNLIVYNESVDRFAPQPIAVDRDSILAARKYINGIRVSGGTNIHGALAEAVAQPARAGSVPIVLFLTDGLPTIGETSEKKIREKIAAANTGARRLFTFGVGVDVNTPLLSRLADDSRATATYVLPKEDVEVKVAAVFRRL